MSEQVSLLPLHKDAILPGETRVFALPSLDVATLNWLQSHPGEVAGFVTVTSPVELPALVSGRWATLAKILAVEPENATLIGVRRIRIASAVGQSVPFQGTYSDEIQTSTDVTEVLDEATRLLEALRAGALPGTDEWQERLPSALLGLVRALATPAELVQSQQTTPELALRQFAQLLLAKRPERDAHRTLERLAVERAAQPQDPEVRRRLWSECVEVMRALDMYDPDLGADESDLARLQKRLMVAGLPKEAREMARRELRLLRGMKSDHHDYATYLGHLDFMARLPWTPDAPRPIDLDAVSQALDREHTGLAKPKQRILEYLAVRKLGGAAASTVLCLVGPPGVGKTTIAQAIAEAMGRKFARVALGGVHDEAELRGFRLTYVAASSGRILQAMALSGSASAVVLLDEIDKLGVDRGRSPGAALLEILDPAQNQHFRDNYLGVGYDLSHALFICTANDAGKIDPILRDRLELIELEGYTLPEKVAIGLNQLWPRTVKDSGLADVPAISAETMRTIVEGYTREPGVRQAQRALASLTRSRALALARGEPRTVEVDDAEVRSVLGPRRYLHGVAEATLPPGVATGLSVSGEGGALLFVEIAVMEPSRPGGGRVRMTGQLGAVLKESVYTALALLRADPHAYGLRSADLQRDLHVHLPDGATPKDGPSAGCALLAALVSAHSGRPVRADVAMTGEISLQGKVLPVGGVRAKVLAAERAGIAEVLVPATNLGDVPAGVQVRIHAVEHVREVVALVLEDAKSVAAAQV